MSGHVLAKLTKIGDIQTIKCLNMGPAEHDMPKLELDTIDRRIIATLQENGRLTNVELAASVGLSPSPCLRRVRRLERQGYIESYRAVLQRRLVGLGLTVFIGVKIEGHANNKAEAFQEAVIAMPETISCHLIAGDIDYLIEVVVPDLDHYQRYLVEKLLNLPIVREVRSYIAIQTLKAGAPLPLHHFDAEPAKPRQ
jgi:Lrp/AsnC family transcriptional regulator, leucine-responsive regulatory protein